MLPANNRSRGTRPDRFIRRLCELRLCVDGGAQVACVENAACEAVVLLGREFLSGRRTLTSAIDELETCADMVAERRSTAFCFPAVIALHASLLSMDASRCRQESALAKARSQDLLRHLYGVMNPKSEQRSRIAARDLAMALAAMSRLYTGIGDLHRALEYARRSRSVAREAADIEVELLALYLQASILQSMGQNSTATALRQMADRLVRGLEVPSTILLDFRLWGMAEQSHDSEVHAA